MTRIEETSGALGRTLDHFGVPPREEEVLAAFAAHKGEVTEGSMASAWAPAFIRSARARR
jgi:hypothetical protein